MECEQDGRKVPHLSQTPRLQLVDTIHDNSRHHGGGVGGVVCQHAAPGGELEGMGTTALTWRSLPACPES